MLHRVVLQSGVHVPLVWPLLRGLRRRPSSAPLVLWAHCRPPTHFCRTEEHVGTSSRHWCLLSAACPLGTEKMCILQTVMNTIEDSVRRLLEGSPW